GRERARRELAPAAWGEAGRGPSSGGGQLVGGARRGRPADRKPRGVACAMARAMPTGPTGPGIKRGWPPSPAVVAQRLERMNRGRVAKRAEREAEARALGEELSG